MDKESNVTDSPVTDEGEPVEETDVTPEAIPESRDEDTVEYGIGGRYVSIGGGKRIPEDR